MAESTKSYDPAQISMIFGLVPIAGGFAENEFVKIEMNNTTFKTKKGADGSTARAKTNDRSGVCTFTLLSTAVANGLLSALATLDELTPGGAGVAPLTVRDRGGAMVFFAAEAWIQKRPDPVFGNEVTERSWEIAFADAIRVDGGS
jgi:hypothetical protein